MNTMILVADSTLARLFSVDEFTSELNEIKAIAHPEGRMHDRDITSDLPGKGEGGGNAHAYEGKTDPKDHSVSEFSRQVVEYIENLKGSDEPARLMVVAPPAFLGELRKHYSGEMSKKIIFELDKNLTHHSLEDIRGHLPKSL